MLGKTTVLTMLTKQTIAQGEKVFYFNGEQTKDDFKNNLYKQSVDKKYITSVQYKNTIIFDSFVVDSKVDELNRIYGENLFLYNNEESRSIEAILYAMEQCKKQHGVKVFILDNFMQIDLKSSDVFQEQTNVMEKLRTFAVNENVHIHLVAHPRKVERNQTRLTLYDIAGSMNLANKAYNIISIMRVDSMDKEGNEYKKLEAELLSQKFDMSKTSTVLEVLKTKGNGCGLVPMVFEKETRTFTQQPKMTSEVYEKKKHEETKNKRGEREICPF